MTGPERVDVEAPRAVIQNIWHRARINAFAHKFAAESFASSSRWTFLLGLVAGVLSILFVIFVYLMNNAVDARAAMKLTAMLGLNHDITALLFTLASIIMALLAIVLSVVGSTEKFDVLAAEHRFFCNSYQYIAQRAREVNWPEKPFDEVVELLKDLERDFALLKARGPEPEDKYFVKGARLFNKIHKDKETRIAQSFDISRDQPASERSENPVGE